jgi:hypothetical protein
MGILMVVVVDDNENIRWRSSMQASCLAKVDANNWDKSQVDTLCPQKLNIMVVKFGYPL